MLMNGILGAITLGIGKVRSKLKMAIFTAFISIILNGLLTYYWGVLGTVIAASIMAFIVSFLFGKIISSVIIFKIPYAFYTKLILFSFVIFTLVKFTGIYPRNWFELTIYGLVYSILFAIFGYILKIYDKKLLFTYLKPKR